MHSVLAYCPQLGQLHPSRAKLIWVEVSGLETGDHIQNDVRIERGEPLPRELRVARKAFLDGVDATCNLHHAVVEGVAARGPDGAHGIATCLMTDHDDGARPRRFSDYSLDPRQPSFEFLAKDRTPIGHPTFCGNSGDGFEYRLDVVLVDLKDADAE